MPARDRPGPSSQHACGRPRHRAARRSPCKPPPARLCSRLTSRVTTQRSVSCRSSRRATLSAQAAANVSVVQAGIAPHASAPRPDPTLSMLAANTFVVQTDIAHATHVSCRALTRLHANCANTSVVQGGIAPRDALHARRGQHVYGPGRNTRLVSRNDASCQLHQHVRGPG
jgi:hypothetical protein